MEQRDRPFLTGCKEMRNEGIKEQGEHKGNNLVSTKLNEIDQKLKAAPPLAAVLLCFRNGLVLLNTIMNAGPAV